MKRVVITGLGGISPIGNNVNEIWNSIKESKSGIDYIKSFDTTNFPIKVAAEIKNLNMEEHLSKRDIKFSSKFINYARIAAKEAFVDSGLNECEFNHDRFGVYIASGIGGIEKLEDGLINDNINPYFIPSTLINLASSQVAIDLQARGSNIAITSACASGSNAIGEAFWKIRHGYEDVILAGCSESSITKKTVEGFSVMRALYSGEDLNRASIPFDEERKGFVIGEGTAILVLEELEHAKRRNAKIYAEIVGYGSSCDAYHLTTPNDEGMYSAKAMEKAITDAGIKPKDIDYINAHGTGTKLNDYTETLAIKNVFEEDYHNVLVSSTKSMTGHLMAAAGAFEALICVKVLEKGFITATINLNNIDEKCDLNLVVNQGIKKDCNYVLSNSFGFGGHNASLVFKKWTE